jgi:hypothetical protein
MFLFCHNAPFSGSCLLTCAPLVLYANSAPRKNGPPVMDTPQPAAPFACVKYNMPYNSQNEYYTVYDYMNEGMYTVYYRNYSVGCPNSEIVVQIAGVLWLA